jgi:hypothetical protein
MLRFLTQRGRERKGDRGKEEGKGIREEGQD